MSNTAGGNFGTYTSTGCFVKDGEVEKRDS